MKFFVNNEIRLGVLLSTIKVPMFDWDISCDFSLVPFDISNDWNDEQELYIVYDLLKNEFKAIETYLEASIHDNLDELRSGGYFIDSILSSYSKVAVSLFKELNIEANWK